MSPSTPNLRNARHSHAVHSGSPPITESIKIKAEMTQPNINFNAGSRQDVWQNQKPSHIREGVKSTDLLASFENRNVQPSKVLGDPIAETEMTKTNVYKSFMNRTSSALNQSDLKSNKQKIAEYKNRMWS